MTTTTSTGTRPRQASPQAMRVRVVPDTTACGLYRLREPTRVLAQLGHDVQVADPDWRIPVVNDPHQGIRALELPDCDVVVLQRVMRADRVRIIQALQARGIAVVVDLDDDVERVDPQHAAYAEFHPYMHRTGPTSWARSRTRPADVGWHWARAACQLADLVTCTTPALARRYAPHGRVAILPNRVPARYLSIRRPVDPWQGDQRPRVGWSGVPEVHPGDLEVTRGAIQQVLTQTGAVFHHIGPSHGVQARLRLADPPTSTGPVPLDRYPLELVKLDVGIVPLADTAFNAAKSWLKGLEFASLGVPFVASPVADYQALTREGIGWLAQSRSDWVRKVTRLVRDRALAMELGERWRAIVAARHTYEHDGAGPWWAAWRWALDLATRRSKATA